MKNKYMYRLKEIYGIMKFESKAYLMSLLGLLKSKIYFKENEVNKLEIGVGKSTKKDGFITSDLSFSTDFPYDLRLGIPFPNESIDLIYSEHVLEHFSYKDLVILLKDCYRTLKDQGVFSLAIPNARIYLKAYFFPEEFEVENYCRYDWGLDYHSKIDYVNYIFYMEGQHRYMFDEDNIVKILSKIGFQNVKIRDYDPTLDKPGRKYESIYVECTK